MELADVFDASDEALAEELARVGALLRRTEDEAARAKCVRSARRGNAHANPHVVPMRHRSR
jgi:hypothetical protein